MCPQLHPPRPTARPERQQVKLESTFFLGVHRTVTETRHKLSLMVNLSKLQRTEIMQIRFFFSFLIIF